MNEFKCTECSWAGMYGELSIKQTCPKCHALVEQVVWGDYE